MLNILLLSYHISEIKLTFLPPFNKECMFLLHGSNSGVNEKGNSHIVNIIIKHIGRLKNIQTT
jgi:hypothetical protein